MTGCCSSGKRGGRKSPVGFPVPGFLILALSRRCNLRCVYCYNGEAVDEDMSPEVMDRAFEFLALSEGPFGVQLTGGEPALVPGLVERAMVKAEDLSKKSGRPRSVAVQTNGTLLSKEFLSLLAKGKVRLGLSIDGPPDLNDGIRGGSRALLEGLELLNSLRMPFNVTTVVSNLNCDSLWELPLFLSAHPGARGIGLDLLVKKGRNGAKPPDPASLSLGVKKLADTLKIANLRRAAAGVAPMVLRELELVKTSARGGGRARFCGACGGSSLAADPKGGLYPCGQAMGEESLSFGTVFEPKGPNGDLGDFTLPGEHCGTCELKGRCPGECPSRLYFNRDESPPLVCALYGSLWGTLKS
jgi:uncharacterized protein